MAKPRTRFELAQVATMVVMLFEDLSHGLMRSIYLSRPHPAKVDLTWRGDSVGRWEGYYAGGRYTGVQRSDAAK